MTQWPFCKHNKPSPQKTTWFSLNNVEGWWCLPPLSKSLRRDSLISGVFCVVLSHWPPRNAGFGKFIKNHHGWYPSQASLYMTNLTNPKQCTIFPWKIPSKITTFKLYCWIPPQKKNRSPKESGQITKNYSSTWFFWTFWNMLQKINRIFHVSLLRGLVGCYAGPGWRPSWSVGTSTRRISKPSIWRSLSFKPRFPKVATGGIN